MQNSKSFLTFEIKLSHQYFDVLIQESFYIQNALHRNHHDFV